jgi:hypothetical protein
VRTDWARHEAKMAGNHSGVCGNPDRALVDAHADGLDLALDK